MPCTQWRPKAILRSSIALSNRRAARFSSRTVGGTMRCQYGQTALSYHIAAKWATGADVMDAISCELKKAQTCRERAAQVQRRPAKSGCQRRELVVSRCRVASDSKK